MKKQLVELIQKKYQMQVEDYQPLRKAWVLQTDLGPFFCKSFVFKDAPRLQFIDGAMRHLINRGFDHVIPFTHNRDQNPYVAFADEVYFMTPFLQTRQCNYDNPDELSKAASLLAGLHLSSWGYRPPNKLNPQLFWGLWPRRLKEKIQHLYTFRAMLDTKQEWDDFDQLYVEFFSYYFQQAKTALDNLLASDYFLLMYNEQIFNTFCHHDFEYHNILIDSKNHYYVIDFDYLLCDTHLHDLTSLIIRTGKRSHWNEKNQEQVLQAYHEIYPIQPAEIPVIKAILLFPQEYWQVAFARYFEQQPWPLERFVSEICRKSRDEDLRLRFIDHLTFPE